VSVPNCSSTLLFGGVLTKSRDFFVGGGPVRVAGIAVKYQGVGLQGVFEFIVFERHSQVVTVGADSIDFKSFAHL
jgi:hypothetical protein